MFSVCQVYFLVKFLVQRGSEVAEEFRHRLKKGQPIHARGYNFSEEACNSNIVSPVSVSGRTRLTAAKLPCSKRHQRWNSWGEGFHWQLLGRSLRSSLKLCSNGKGRALPLRGAGFLDLQWNPDFRRCHPVTRILLNGSDDLHGQESGARKLGDRTQRGQGNRPSNRPGKRLLRTPR